jgi:hypothetical protein
VKLLSFSNALQLEMASSGFCVTIELSGNLEKNIKKYNYYVFRWEQNANARIFVCLKASRFGKIG